MSGNAGEMAQRQRYSVVFLITKTRACSCFHQGDFAHHLYISLFPIHIFIIPHTLIVTICKDKSEAASDEQQLLRWLTLCGSRSGNVPLDTSSSELSVKQLNVTRVKWLWISTSAYFGPSKACGSRAGCDFKAARRKSKTK